MGRSYTYFNICHVYHLIFFGLAKYMSHKTTSFYLFMECLIYFDISVNNSSVKNFSVLIIIYLFILLLLLLYKFSIIII